MDEDTESRADDDALDLTPRKELLISLSVAMWFVVFFGAAAVSAYSPEAIFSLGSRGSSARIPLTREQGLLISIPFLLVGAAVSANMRRAWKSVEPGAVAPQIPLSETVLWSGRQGWRSFRGPRIVSALMAMLVLACPDKLPPRASALARPLWLAEVAREWARVNSDLPISRGGRPRIIR